MDNYDTKMNELQEMMRLLANALSNMKGELLSAIEKVERKLSGRMDKLDKKIDGVEKRLTKRIDKIGLQVASLEDDTPTREEFDNLELKVKKIDHIVLSA